MNKFITSTTLLSIGFLTSCSTINSFRQDPDTWGEKGKKEKTLKVSKPVELPKPRPVVTQNQPTNYTPTAVTSNKVNQVTKTTQKGRTIAGMVEPDVTKLPDNKDLQESNNVAPIPHLPKLVTPLAPLLPNDSFDPSTPLPSNP